MSEKQLKTSCHCGAIKVTAPRLPNYINECQCSICRRYGAAWAYYKFDEVKISPEVETSRHDQSTIGYFWGNRAHSFDFCSKCGSIMYWWPINEKGEQTHESCGINTRMVNDPDDLNWVERRITYEDAKLVKPGVYDEKGRIEGGNGAKQ